MQDRFRSTFDLILHGDNIPKLFTNQNMGNIVRVKIPQNYSGDKKMFTGIAVYALVVVNKQTGKLNDIQEPERYTKVVDLI